MTAEQLILGLRLEDRASFDNYYAGNKNQEVLKYLKQLDKENIIYIWGEKGIGCTHLLHAINSHAEQEGKICDYLSLKDNDDFSKYIDNDILCVDDIEEIAGKRKKEESIFHLYNHALETGQYLIIAGKNHPKNLNLTLPDLVSRLCQAMNFHLQPLDDEEKIAVLVVRAKDRGMTLPRDCAEFLLNRWPRDFNALFNAIEQLDEASIREQRKLTKPFIKMVLNI